MTWLLGPWPLFLMSALWLFQGVAYAHRKDWGHAVMAVSYGVGTWGLIFVWFRP